MDRKGLLWIDRVCLITRKKYYISGVVWRILAACCLPRVMLHSFPLHRKEGVIVWKKTYIKSQRANEDLSFP